jgi:ribonuclease HII
MSKSESLFPFYDVKNRFEIGIDESSKGKLAGRVYVAAVILPKDGSFDFSKIKDSKKIHSKKKMIQLAEYIKINAISWYIHFVEPDVIDKINIRQAVLLAMHECVKQIISKNKDSSVNLDDYFILVDGNDFTPHLVYDDQTEKLVEIPHSTIVKGDNQYSSIAAASILAKSAGDNYILELCAKHPELTTMYGFDKNMGYGTKQHIDGIKKYGISPWHRRSFGICGVTSETTVFTDTILRSDNEDI